MWFAVLLSVFVIERTEMKGSRSPGKSLVPDCSSMGVIFDEEEFVESGTIWVSNTTKVEEAPFSVIILQILISLCDGWTCRREEVTVQ